MSGTSPDGVGSYRDIGRHGKTPSGLTLQSLAIRPRARGSVSLRSSDAADAPVLDPAFGTSDADMATLREGLRLSRRLVEQPAFDGVRGEEAWPRLDLDAMHRYLSQSYWSPGVPREVVKRAADGSLAVGLYDGEGAQVGYARVVTDRATFAYLCDVYVLLAPGASWPLRKSRRVRAPRHVR